MAIGLAGFWRRDLTLLIVALALMGVHSTLFGPVKYAILPQHLKPEELIGGNGLVEMGTFVAILLGTIAGGLVVAIDGTGPVLAGGVAIAVAVAGYLREPRHPAHAGGRTRPQDQLEPVHRDVEEPRASRRATASSGCRCSASRGSGSTARFFLRSSPGFSKDILGGDEHVVTSLLALFSVGIGVGSLLCERLSGRKVELGLVPFGSIGLTVFARRPVAREPQPARERRSPGSTSSSPTPRTGAWPPTSC